MRTCPPSIVGGGAEESSESRDSRPGSGSLEAFCFFFLEFLPEADDRSLIVCDGRRTRNRIGSEPKV